MHREDRRVSRRDLGQELRETRERKGLALDDLAEGTRIRRDYLEALEHGDYDVFPGEYWARQFLRSYALALGIDAAMVTNQAFGPESPMSRTGGAGSAATSSAQGGDLRERGGGTSRERSAGDTRSREGTSPRDAARARLEADQRVIAKGARSASPERPAASNRAAQIDRSLAARPGKTRRIASAALPEPDSAALSRRAARRRAQGGGWITGGLALLAAVVVALLAATLWPRAVKAPTRSALAPATGRTSSLSGGRTKGPVTASGSGSGSGSGKGTGRSTSSRASQTVGTGGRTQAKARPHPRGTTGPKPRTATVTAGSLAATGPNTYVVGAPSLEATLHVGYLSWVHVNADGKLALWKEEPSRFTTTFSARHTLAVYLGYPQGSTIQVDGHEVGPFTATRPEWYTFETRPTKHVG